MYWGASLCLKLPAEGGIEPINLPFAPSSPPWLSHLPPPRAGKGWGPKEGKVHLIFLILLFPPKFAMSSE